MAPLRSFAITFFTILIASLGTPAWAEPEGEVRHSGKIVEIDRANRRVVLEEMKAWHGPDQPGIVHRSIAITPETSIQLVERTDEWGNATTSLPGWRSKALDPGRLRVGDFATVTTGPRDRSRAVALQVIRPSA
jgi:hypothetical protein